VSSPDRADVVIVGGAIVGSAVATFLASRPDWHGRVLMIERDPTFRTSSTTLSAASIRLQFSTSLNIEISRFGVELIKHLDRWLGVEGQPAPEVDFVEGLAILRQNEQPAVGIVDGGTTAGEAVADGQNAAGLAAFDKGCPQACCQ